jgi:CRP/FNR family cyclic AMP-dependent transcriptional regulator
MDNRFLYVCDISLSAFWVENRHHGGMRFERRSISHHDHVPGVDPRALVGCGTTIDLPAGYVLCREGEVGRQVFIILDGEASVINADGVVAQLGPGDIAGEMAVVSRRPRNADVVCATDVTVRVFTPREFRSLRHGDPEFAASLDDLIASRV